VKRTALALETMQLYAPMAHALDAGPLCAELEDLSLKELFPSSYRSLEQWLRGEGPADRIALDRAREWLFDALVADPGLMTLVGVARRATEGGGAFYTLVHIRPRWRGERRSLRTFSPGVSLRPPPAFNPRPRGLSTPSDAFELHPDVRS
jgi:hypothetical protein